MKKTWLVAFVAFGFHSLALAGEKPDAAKVEEALRLTQEMLKDPAQRQNQIDKSAEGKAADQKIKGVAGSAENEQAIYDLAADVFGSMSKETGGDPEKMQQLLNEGLKDPESFAKRFSPEELQKLHDIAAKTPSKSLKK